MYIVGIDIGKNHHEASIVSPEGKQIGRSLRFATTHKGADSLMSFIFKNIGNSPCVFGMEATGHYWYIGTREPSTKTIPGFVSLMTGQAP